MYRQYRQYSADKGRMRAWEGKCDFYPESAVLPLDDGAYSIRSVFAESQLPSSGNCRYSGAPVDTVDTPPPWREESNDFFDFTQLQRRDGPLSNLVIWTSGHLDMGYSLSEHQRIRTCK